ncbi:MAG: glycosyltransferase [Actinomycetota bacterium]|nr:glycosyltransferase [Actinomycetota bacterium]
MTEAGPAVGLGHLARCVALYDAFCSIGFSCNLVVAGDAPSHITESRKVNLLDWHSSTVATGIVEGAGIVVIDSYLANQSVYRAVAERSRVAVYLDDTARLPYPSGFVVNGNPAASEIGIELGLGTTALLGPQYQILREQFSAGEPHPICPVIERILVVSGGADVKGALRAMAETAYTSLPTAELDLVDEPRTAQEMRDAMLAADIAVTAAGQTIYELAALGVPAVAVCVADNQVAQAQAFERAGALRIAGAWGRSNPMEHIPELLMDLAAPDIRACMSVAGQRLVDGRGAFRVAQMCSRAYRKTASRAGGHA